MWSFLCVLSGMYLCVFVALSGLHLLLTKVELLDRQIEAIVSQPITDCDTFVDTCLQQSLRLRPWWVPRDYVQDTVQDFVYQYKSTNYVSPFLV